ncbi:NUDIX domain-containing protein [Candidatus Roizmanbacteria bacterium]|nr:NUDIX domain-containing protein [Candidatus Roizmanbacteria bacterium]
MQTTDNQKELFIVVDEKDNILGYKTRYECHHDKNLIHRGVGVALFNLIGEIAFQKRSKTKDHYPGLYTLTSSGHVSKGESYHRAATRELKEEVGVENIKLEFVSKRLIVFEKEKGMDTFYKGTYNGEFVIDRKEVDGIYYFSKSQILTIKHQMTSYCLSSLEVLGWI